MEICVLGSREVVVALSLAGLPGRAIDGKGDLIAALDDPEMTGTVRILVVEEMIADLDRNEIDRMKLDPSGPLIVEIPGIRGPGESRRTPLDLVRQALGINL